MSYQQYVDNLMASDNFDDIAFVDANGKTLAATDGFEVTADEASRAAVALEEGSDRRKELGVGGTKYSVMSQEPGIIFARLGFKGMTIHKTKGAILVGVFPGGKNKDARDTVEKVVGEMNAAGH